ncbi:hypothetical protein [Actinoplanes subglobosus]|uniref:Uncharacterized protein n=1 Tax=Actinoplanes subglobosus TaxID=1547892 RepID=A0ABV8J0T1_9ACTN
MSAESWPVADERLVRTYRRLLLAYSGPYRRRHGTEMITTMLEMAEPGRSRPSAGEAWHLIHSGVRQRFRLPAGRPLAAVTAVLVAMILGVFGAAAGSWVGQGTFTDLPSRAGAVEIMDTAVADPAPDAGHVRLDRMAGREDTLTLSVPPRDQRPDVTTWTAEDARAGLVAAGWTVTGFTLHEGQPPVCTTDEEGDRSCLFEPRYADLTAERDGLVLTGRAEDALGGEAGKMLTGGIVLTLFAERSVAYLPLTVAGGLLGALAGWLLAAAAAYRIRCLPPGSGLLVSAAAGMAVVLSAAPVWAIALNSVMFAKRLGIVGPVHTVHSMLTPGAHPDGASPWLIPALALASVMTAAIAIGVLFGRAVRDEPHGSIRPV